MMLVAIGDQLLLWRLQKSDFKFYHLKKIRILIWHSFVKKSFPFSPLFLNIFAISLELKIFFNALHYYLSFFHLVFKIVETVTRRWSFKWVIVFTNILQISWRECMHLLTYLILNSYVFYYLNYIFKFHFNMIIADM